MFRRACLALVLVTGATGVAGANTVTGRIDLAPTAPERPPQKTKGFLDRVENPLAQVKAVNITAHLAVVLEGDEKPAAPGQVVWELVGESFGRNVIAVPAGAEVVIKNTSRTSRTLTALEDPKLVPHEPINPTGPKSFKVPEAGKAYTITDTDAPHLVGKLVVVNTPFVSKVDDAGKFEFTDVPPGEYRVRIYYFDAAAGKDGWLDRPADSVNVGTKGKAEVNPKLAAGYAVVK
jgi:hypothetical protein